MYALQHAYQYKAQVLSKYIIIIRKDSRNHIYNIQIHIYTFTIQKFTIHNYVLFGSCKHNCWNRHNVTILVCLSVYRTNWVAFHVKFFKFIIVIISERQRQHHHQQHHHHHKLVANKSPKGVFFFLLVAHSFRPSTTLFYFFCIRILRDRYDDILIINFYWYCYIIFW